VGDCPKAPTKATTEPFQTSRAEGEGMSWGGDKPPTRASSRKEGREEGGGRRGPAAGAGAGPVPAASESLEVQCLA